MGSTADCIQSSKHLAPRVNATTRRAERTTIDKAADWKSRFLTGCGNESKCSLHLVGPMQINEVGLVARLAL